MRWGILAPGWISELFVDGVNAHTESSIVATGSRSLERATAFAEKYNGGTPYGSYEELVNDPNVDVVYVASPHSHHREHALLAINAGKHVLVEKAFAQNVAQAQEIVDAAKAKGVFCMEAMWTRHLPHVIEIHEAIARGDIGDVISVQADHGQFFPFNPEHRLYNAELAGGALLDLGVYPLAFAHDILGVPESVTAIGQMTETNVDGQISMVLDYGGQTQATLHTTLWSKTPTTASICGTKGRIDVDPMFYTPTGFTLTLNDGTETRFDGSFPNGYAYEAAEVARRITNGDTESPVMTLDMSMEIMRLMDEIRSQIGLVYPNEK